MHRRLERLWLVLCFAAAVAVLPAAAAPIPFAEREVQLTAREQPVGQFLADLFGLVDLPVVASDKLRGAVNGSFRGDAGKVWANVARSFNLVAYYDGSVVYVYTPGELGTRTLPMSVDASARVRRNAQELRMLDNRNSLRSTAEGTLVVMGTRRFIEQIEELARGQVAATAARPPQGFEVFFLRYAWAHDVSAGFGGRQVVVPGVASIVRALMTGNPHSQVQVQVNDQARPPTVPKLKGQGLMNRSSAPAGAAAGDSVAALLAAYAADPDNAAAALAAGGGNASTAAAAAPRSDGGPARVEVDTRLNAVIVRDVPEKLPQYRQLIAALDVEPQALEIEARIVDIDTSRMRELGINWRLNSRRGSALFGSGTNADLALTPTTPPALITPLGRGGFVSAVLGGGNELALRINALQDQGAAKVVSSPQVLTLSNVEAVFDTSRTFYVRVAGRDEVDLFSVSAGTTLRVTPHVFKDGNDVRIKLLVAIDDGTLSQQQVDQIPVVERATINTQALIYEGESLLVGGLTRERSSSGVTKVPGLGDIPLIGNLFKTTSDSNERTERLFLIMPRLVPARRALAAAAAPTTPGAALLQSDETTPAARPAEPPASPPAAPAPQAPVDPSREQYR